MLPTPLQLPERRPAPYIINLTEYLADIFLHTLERNLIRLVLPWVAATVDRLGWCWLSLRRTKLTLTVTFVGNLLTILFTVPLRDLLKSARWKTPLKAPPHTAARHNRPRPELVLGVIVLEVLLLKIVVVEVVLILLEIILKEWIVQEGILAVLLATEPAATDPLASAMHALVTVV